MAEVAAGGREAFGRLYDRFCERAYGVARAVCADERRAEDAMEAAFQTVWEERASYSRQRGTVAAWLLTIVRDRAGEITRRQGDLHVDEADDDHLNSSSATAEPANIALLEQITEAHLRASLARLPEEHQEVIILAYFGQLSHIEIATQLDLAPGIVKGRMRLGLHELQRQMSQQQPK